MSLALAIVGMVITLYGRWLKTSSPYQQQAFLWGAVLLCISAALDQELVLTILEVIIILGCILGFTHFKHSIKISIIIVTTIISLVILNYLSATLTSLVLLGMAGLVGAAAGFATKSLWVQLGSGIILIVYNTLNWWDGSTVAPIFLFLNVVFQILVVRLLLTSNKN